MRDSMSNSGWLNAGAASKAPLRTCSDTPEYARRPCQNTWESSSWHCSGTCPSSAFSSCRHTTSGRSSRESQSQNCACRARMPLTFQVPIFTGYAEATRQQRRQAVVPAKAGTSFRLNAGFLHHLRPPHGLGGDVGGERLRIERLDAEADGLERLAHVRGGERLAGRAPERRDHLARRARPGPPPPPPPRIGDAGCLRLAA